MTSPLELDRKQFFDRLINGSTEYDYRFTRYKSDYSIAIAYIPEAADLSSLSAYIRHTDRFVVLSKHLYAVVFDNSDHERGLKAANNLLTYFLHSYFGRSIYTAIVTASDYHDPALMIKKLFDLLEYGIRHNMDTLIIDNTQIMKTV